MKKPRLYADTSVFGGCFDDEFSEESLALFDEIIIGKFILIISTTLLRELDRAPDFVQQTLANIATERTEFIELNEEIINLRNEYIKANILSKSYASDAEHIASASVANVDIVVSWNFKHLVHYEKISGFQAVNLLNGYKPIHIYSPKEVISL